MVAGLGEFAFENFPGAGAFFAEDQALGEEIRDGDLLSGEGVVDVYKRQIYAQL